MNFDIFASDYGVLPSGYFGRKALTNPIELFWCDDLIALLRLCGAKEEMIGERASDYDRFCAVCRALPLLNGHPARAWIESIFEKHFGIKELPAEEDVPKVWKKLCESLLQNPIASKDLVEGDLLCEPSTYTQLPENVTPVLNANFFLHSGAKTVESWQHIILSVVTRFAAGGCKKIVLNIGEGFDFALPSLYHVDRALSLPQKNREATNLLICQLVRELCVVAQEQDILLVFLCGDDPSALARLLEYAEGSVGLPRICWCAREAREAHKLLEFTARPHKNEILAALPYESVMTQNELSNAIEAWQVRYPIGRLCFITARDLRQTPHAQAHLADMLKNLKTKI